MIPRLISFSCLSVLSASTTLDGRRLQSCHLWQCPCFGFAAYYSIVNRKALARKKQVEVHVKALVKRGGVDVVFVADVDDLKVPFLLLEDRDELGLTELGAATGV